MSNKKSINDLAKESNLEIWSRTYQTIKDGADVLCDIKELLDAHLLVWADIISQVEATETQLLTAADLCKLNDAVEILLCAIYDLLKTPKYHPCGLGGPIFICTDEEIVYDLSCCGVLYGQANGCTNMKFQLPICNCNICVNKELKTITVGSVVEEITNSTDIVVQPSLCIDEELSEEVTLSQFKALYELEKKKFMALCKGVLACKNRFLRAKEKLIFYVDTFELFDSDLLTA